MIAFLEHPKQVNNNFSNKVEHFKKNFILTFIASLHLDSFT